MVLGSSVLVSAVSGGKSTMRNTEPPRGGMMPMSIAARSAVPEREVGRRLICHPQQPRDGLGLRANLLMWSSAVEQHHGLVVAVDRGDHAANVCAQSHNTSPPASAK